MFISTHFVIDIVYCVIHSLNYKWVEEKYFCPFWAQFLWIVDKLWMTVNLLAGRDYTLLVLRCIMYCSFCSLLLVAVHAGSKTAVYKSYQSRTLTVEWVSRESCQWCRAKCQTMILICLHRYLCQYRRYCWPFIFNPRIALLFLHTRIVLGSQKTPTCLCRKVGINRGQIGNWPWLSIGAMTKVKVIKSSCQFKEILHVWRHAKQLPVHGLATCLFYFTPTPFPREVTNMVPYYKQEFFMIHKIWWGLCTPKRSTRVNRWILHH